MFSGTPHNPCGIARPDPDAVLCDAARAAIFDYIELFYNRSRMHQSLGYVSPVKFEKMKGVA